MDFNYLEISFKNGTCYSPNKIAKPKLLYDWGVGGGGFGDNNCFEKII
jgi:hypothetical protein